MTQPPGSDQPDPYAAPPPGSSPPPGQPQYGQPPYGAPQYGAPQYGQPPPSYAYASWLQRVGAYLIDAIVSGLPAFVLILLGTAIGHGIGALFLIVGYLGGFGIWLWNYVFRQGTTGQSIGKQQLNIRLIRESDGQPVGPGMAFIRGIAHILDSLACYIGWLWPLWDSKRQTFADKVCSTVVIPA